MAQLNWNFLYSERAFSYYYVSKNCTTMYSSCNVMVNTNIQKLAYYIDSNFTFKSQELLIIYISLNNIYVID